MALACNANLPKRFAQGIGAMVKLGTSAVVQFKGRKEIVFINDNKNHLVS